MKLKLSTVTIKLKLPIAALLLGAGLTACTPQPDSNIVEDNMEFAQQQLRCAFDEIDYAVANESPESATRKERMGATHQSPEYGTGRDASPRPVQRLDQRILPRRALVSL